MPASVVVAQMSGAPYDQLADGFTDKRAEAKGMTIHEKSPAGVSGRCGLMVRGTQFMNGSLVGKDMLLLGAPEGALMVVGNTPPGASDAFRARTDAVVRSVQWSPAAPPTTRELGFDISVSAPFQPVEMLSGAQTFSEGGKPPHLKSTKAVLIVAPGAMLTAARANSRMFATNALLSANFDDIQLDEPRGQSVGLLEVVEVTGTGRNPGKSDPLFLYQAIVYTPDLYYRFFGRTDEARRDMFLPIFREAVQSFKLKAKRTNTGL